MPILSPLFVSHGSPTVALDPGTTGPALARIARALPRPAAVVVASAHWEASVPLVGAAARPETIHDFHGFPRPLFEITYPAPGAPTVAERVRELLSAAGFDARLDTARGLDHGAWVPLRFMYPAADVPVLQVAIQPDAGPGHHYRLGAALAPLAAEGVLVMGSGSATHNLREVMWRDPTGAAPDWVQSFRTWVKDALARGDIDALLDYRRRAPNGVRNHPTEEHLLPLFVALGVAGPGARVEHAHDDVTFGVLGMDAFLFNPVPTASAVG